MRHIDFQFKHFDRYENVKLFFDNETLHDDFFVFDLNEIRFTFDKFRSKFDVFDSIAIHHHFLVRQQMNAMTLNYDQQFSFLYLRCQRSRTSRTISNICSRDEIFEKFDFVRFHAHYFQKSNFIQRRQSDDQHHRRCFDSTKFSQSLQTKSKTRLIIQYDVTLVDNDAIQSFLIFKSIEKTEKIVD